MTQVLEIELIAFLSAFFTSLLVSIVLVLTKAIHIHRTAKGQAHLEIQSAHQHPTPRVGGLAFAAGVLVFAYLLHDVTGPLLGYALVAVFPVFFAGLLEDIGVEASPRERLFATIVSSLMMVVLTGQTINAGVAPGIDALLDIFVVSVVFTIFTTVAVCHSFNLVDGMNGLAISIAIVASIALAVIALGAGDFQVATMAGGVAVAALGVFFLNFPFGKLFLGDAGAYTVGFLVAWIGVCLMARNPDVSCWSVLLTVFWPFVDTTAAVLRRALKRVSITKADNLHFHHIVMRWLAINSNSRIGLADANPLTTVVVLPLVAIPACVGIVTAHDGRLALLCLLFCILGYYAVRHTVMRGIQDASGASEAQSGFDELGESRLELLG